MVVSGLDDHDTISSRGTTNEQVSGTRQRLATGLCMIKRGTTCSRLGRGMESEDKRYVQGLKVNIYNLWYYHIDRNKLQL